MSTAVKRSIIGAALWLLGISQLLVACGGGGSHSPSDYSIGGTVSGLAGSGLVLQDNAGDDLPIASDGTFAFKTSISGGSDYAVTIKSQPMAPAQSCAVKGGSGAVGGANITTVGVTCTTNTYAVGGTVNGLLGSGLVLQDNSGNDLPIAANGSFVFTVPVASGTAYVVTAKVQPTAPAQTCALSGASGTIANAAVVNVGVTCTTNTYKVGGTVSGLLGSGLVLQDNSGNDLPIAANGSFVFTSRVASGLSYAVSVSTQPAAPLQTCVLSGANGSITNSDVTGVAVTCTSSPSRFAYVAGSAGIDCFAINAISGALVLLEGSPCDTRPTSVTVDSSGKFLYATYPGNNIISYSINSLTGLLTVTAGSELPGGDNPVDITLNPSGTFAYMANYGGSVSAYKINPAGSLAVVSGSPFAQAPGLGINKVIVDPTGHYLYTANDFTNDLWAFAIDSTTGTLTDIPGSPFADNGGPLSAVIDPSGKFLYTANFIFPNTGTVAAYNIDAGTGALTPIAGSPFASAGASGLTFDQSGSFLYVTNASSNAINAYAIDKTTGVLTAISGSPFSSDLSPYTVIAEPSGRFLYVVSNTSSSTVTAFGIDPATGKLTAIGGSPFAAPGSQIIMAIGK
jgi:6-phosphogluconolactonase (cycloisomerase 2 family)